MGGYFGRKTKWTERENFGRNRQFRPKVLISAKISTLLAPNFGQNYPLWPKLTLSAEIVLSAEMMPKAKRFRQVPKVSFLAESPKEAPFGRTLQQGRRRVERSRADRARQASLASALPLPHSLHARISWLAQQVDGRGRHSQPKPPQEQVADIAGFSGRLAWQ